MATETLPADDLPAGRHDGELRDAADYVSHTLFQVLTLVKAAHSMTWEAIELGEGAADPDGMTDANSRTSTLLLIAEERVRDAIVALQPHV